MRAMEDEMNALTSGFGGMPAFDMGSAMPSGTRALAVDILDKGNELQIKADVPGMTKDDIKVGGWGARRPACCLLCSSLRRVRP